MLRLKNYIGPINYDNNYNRIAPFDTFVNRCGAEELINVDNINSKVDCDRTASENPEQLISWKCKRRQ
jgi:hypothetical protein